MAFARVLHDAVATVVDGVVATYLHGSAALGGFVPGRSDVDILVVHDGRPLTASGLQLAAEALRASADVCPGRGIELSLVTAHDAAAPAPPWPFLLHVATGGSDAKTVLGVGHRGDPDLLMHYAVCRAAGVAVSGPDTTQLIGEISRSAVLRYLETELDWALEHAPEAYGVLNASRALAYARHNTIISKIAGAELALADGAPRELIARALAMQCGRAPDQRPSEEAEAYIRKVRAVLVASHESG